MSIWYNCKNYRANLFSEGGVWRLRDIHLFNEKYIERYLEQPVCSNIGIHDTLPVMDGFLWTNDKKDRAGIYLTDALGINFRITDKPDITTPDEKTLVANAQIHGGGTFTTIFDEDNITFEMSRNETEWQLKFNLPAVKTDLSVEQNRLKYLHNGFAYFVEFTGSVMAYNKRNLAIKPVNKTIHLKFCRKLSHRNAFQMT